MNEAADARDSRLTLRFPNDSRSFDAARCRVRFWGYASALEIAFFVEEDALRMIDPDIDGSEAGFLRAFDSARRQIEEAADRAYVRDRRRQGVYSLSGKDF